MSGTYSTFNRSNIFSDLNIDYTLTIPEYLKIDSLKACNPQAIRRTASYTDVELQPLPIKASYSKGNVKLVDSVEESFEWKKEMISIAESSIELSPSFAGGKDFREVLDLIEERMRKKPLLQVHLILCKNLLENADIQKLNQLVCDFGDRFVYLISDQLLYRNPLRTEENHTKMLIVDGKYFVMGGSGIHPRMTRETSDSDSSDPHQAFAAHFISKFFRDADIVGEGPVALTMRRYFYTLFKKWEGRMGRENPDRFSPLDGAPRGVSDRFVQDTHVSRDADMKFLAGGPQDQDHHPITRKFCKRIGRTEKEMRFASPLFNPDEKIKRALKEKKKGDAKIIGYFNGGQKNPTLVQNVYTVPSRYNYSLVDRVHEYEVQDQLYHKKVASFDGKYVMIGSYNMGQKSAHWDDEIMMQIRNCKVAGQVDTMLDEDAKRSIAFPTPPRLNKFRKFLSMLFIKITQNFIG